MLELPESYTIAKQIREHLQGKIISYVEVLHKPHKFAWINSEQGSVADLLEGQTIAGASFHGGMLEITTEDSMLLLSDGAYPKYYENKKKFPKNHQLALYFDDFLFLQIFFQKRTCMLCPIEFLFNGCTF